MVATTPPTTIRAWQHTHPRNGLENALTLNTIPTPTPKLKQHLIRIHACALNPVDYKSRENPIISRLLVRKPGTPGKDISGTIITPAAGSALKIGQRVFGVAGATPFDDGGLREICTTPVSSVVALPEGLDMIDAATIAVAGLSAYQPIVPYVKKGDRVFLNGGSGGTGTFGIQIAKAVGCYVATSCSGRNVELCKKLGADEVIDYTKENVVEQLKKLEKFDHVVDNAGGDLELYWRCHEYTNPGARYIMVAGELSLKHSWGTFLARTLPGFLGGGKRPYSGFFPSPKSEDLLQIGNWIREGKVKATIDERFKFEDVPAAFLKLKTGRARGKVVVEVDTK